MTLRKPVVLSALGQPQLLQSGDSLDAVSVGTLIREVRTAPADGETVDVGIFTPAGTPHFHLGHNLVVSIILTTKDMIGNPIETMSKTYLLTVGLFAVSDFKIVLPVMSSESSTIANEDFVLEVSSYDTVGLPTPCIVLELRIRREGTVDADLNVTMLNLGPDDMVWTPSTTVASPALCTAYLSGASNILMSKHAPPGDIVVIDGHYAYAVDYYEIAAGRFLEVGVGSAMEIG